MSEKFYHLYEEISNLSIEELINVIKRSPRLKFGDAKLTDLIINGQAHIGVYILFDPKGIPVYVGKTGSRTLIERIAGHFDFRHWAYMNSFLCALTGKKKSRKGPHATTEEIESVYPISLNYSLVFLSIPDKAIINRLEGIITRELGPILNSSSSKRPYEVSDLVRNL